MTKMSLFPKAVKKETLAEQVAGSIKEAILAGQWSPGEALPTEPELAEAFGVSRAVVRDATRMLAAQGLVEAQHGRGVFVTESQVEAFGDALLLALRREGATVWDVEQFDQMILPEVAALAAVQATDEDLTRLKKLAANYIAAFAAVSEEQWKSEDPEDVAALEATSTLFRAFISAVFETTHNAMWQLLVQPILRLRSMREWDPGDADIPPDYFISFEKKWVNTLVEAIGGGDAQAAREAVAELVQLPQEAETAMRSTPIGEKPHIPMAYPPSTNG
ncbi:MAG: FadR/GntR family transcriptional regulator [Candidatus Promineifilaceae bacterium]|jgi:DNA-binding FadR family transcriptional regulator